MLMPTWRAAARRDTSNSPPASISFRIDISRSQWLGPLPRIEQQRFIWPRMAEGDTVSMSGAELDQLLDGFDVRAEGHRALQLKIGAPNHAALVEPSCGR
jgi:hypothetical protein